MFRASSRSRIDNKLPHQSSIFQIHTSGKQHTPFAKIGCNDQDWYFVIKREKSEHVVQEIISDILCQMDNLILHRYVRHFSVEYAVARIKDDLIHMCEWLYAKQDVEADESYFINLDDEEPSPLDIDSLGSGSLPSISHSTSVVEKDYSPPITLVLHQITPVTNICPSMPLTNFKELPLPIKEYGEEIEEDGDKETQVPKEQYSSEGPVEKVESTESHIKFNATSQTKVIAEESPFSPKVNEEITVIRSPMTHMDKDIIISNEPKHKPLLHHRKLLGRTRNKPPVSTVPINCLIKDQIFHLQTTKDSQTYREIKAFSKLVMKETIHEVIPVQPHPTTINSIKLSQGVTIFHLDQVKENPSQMKDVNYDAIKLEKSKNLQLVPGCMRGIIEPLLSTQVKVNPQPLTLPPITRSKKKSRTIC